MVKRGLSYTKGNCFPKVIKVAMPPSLWEPGHGNKSNKTTAREKLGENCHSRSHEEVQGLQAVEWEN